MSLRIFASAVALMACGSASASFVGLSLNSSVIDGKAVFRVYAQFNNPNDTVLNVFGVNNISGAGIYQNDLAGGSWNPQFTTDPADSFVTIGGSPGFFNSTSADPGWGDQGFQQVGIPMGAGWFNSNPPNLQGRADPVTLQTLIAQFSFAGQIVPFFSPFSIGYNQGIGTATQFGTASGFPIPAPGALLPILIGLAGSRRRRR